MSDTTATPSTSPRVYVGTYAKYNNGSIQGAWLDLDDYTDRADFYEAAKALHADEADPELMFQDFENFPRSLYSESNVSDELIVFANLDDDDRELLAVYHDHVDSSGDIDKAREAYCGKYDTEADWAEQFLNDTGGLEGVPEHLKNYIDFESYGRDARIGGDMTFVRHDGELWAFHNH
jgi:antirestriction protein